MGVAIRRKVQSIDITARFSLLPLNSSRHQSCSAPCRSKSFPSSACCACLPCRYSLLPLWLLPATPYSWNALFRYPSACHRQLCSHINCCFSFQTMYMSHFLLVSETEVLPVQVLTYTLSLQSPSASGAKPQLYWCRQSAPNTHCWLYYLHQRPSNKHISRRKHVLCANLHQQVNRRWLPIPPCTMDRPTFTIAFGLCVKMHIMLVFGSE